MPSNWLLRRGAELHQEFSSVTSSLACAFREVLWFARVAKLSNHKGEGRTVVAAEPNSVPSGGLGGPAVAASSGV